MKVELRSGINTATISIEEYDELRLDKKQLKLIKDGNMHMREYSRYESRSEVFNKENEIINKLEVIIKLNENEINRLQRQIVNLTASPNKRWF